MAAFSFKTCFKNCFYALSVPVSEKCFCIFLQGNLYIFGGMVDSAFTQAKTPLWIYDIGMIHNSQSFPWDISSP